MVGGASGVVTGSGVPGGSIASVAVEVVKPLADAATELVPQPAAPLLPPILEEPESPKPGRNETSVTGAIPMTPAQHPTGLRRAPASTASTAAVVAPAQAVAPTVVLEPTVAAPQQAEAVVDPAPAGAAQTALVAVDTDVTAPLAPEPAPAAMPPSLAPGTPSPLAAATAQPLSEAGLSPAPTNAVTSTAVLDAAAPTLDPADVFVVVEAIPLAATRAGAVSSASPAVATAAPMNAIVRSAAEPVTRPSQGAAGIVRDGQRSGAAPLGAASPGAAPGAAPSGSAGSSGAPSAWLPSAQLLLVALALLAAIAIAARRPPSMAYAPATYPD
jgi:hypothetical protein